MSCYHLVVLTGVNLGEIAKISSDFIEAYIKAYNEGESIEEVILENRQVTPLHDNPGYLLLSCNTVVYSA
jgi:hypothetical protein